MVTSLSALEPKITNMVPSTWHRVDKWRQWSLFTGQGRCAGNNSTVSSYKDCTWPTYGEKLRTIMTDANKKAFLQNAENCSLIRWSTFKVFLDITSIQLSWFFLNSSILCLFRATKRCRYGTNRTGITVRRKTTVIKLVLMCIHGVLNSFYWRPFLRWS